MYLIYENTNTRKCCYALASDYTPNEFLRVIKSSFDPKAQPQHIRHSQYPQGEPF